MGIAKGDILIVDRISARHYIAAGLLLSGVCNLLFSLMPSYGALLLCWGLNGAAQSMLWTPIVKVMAVWFKGKRRTKASFGISMTLVLGHCAMRSANPTGSWSSMSLA